MTLFFIATLLFEIIYSCLSDNFHDCSSEPTFAVLM